MLSGLRGKCSNWVEILLPSLSTGSSPYIRGKFLCVSLKKDQKIERVTPQFKVAVTKVCPSHLKPTLSLLNEVFVLTKVPLLVIRLSLGSLKNHKSFPFKSPPHSLPLRHFEEAQIQTYNPFAIGES